MDDFELEEVLYLIYSLECDLAICNLERYSMRPGINQTEENIMTLLTNLAESVRIIMDELKKRKLEGFDFQRKYLN